MVGSNFPCAFRHVSRWHLHCCIASVILQALPPPLFSSQWLPVRGRCACCHEKRDPADQRAEEETGEHRQDRSVAGIRPRLGGRRPSFQYFTSACGSVQDFRADQVFLSWQLTSGDLCSYLHRWFIPCIFIREWLSHPLQVVLLWYLHCRHF